MVEVEAVVVVVAVAAAVVAAGHWVEKIFVTCHLAFAPIADQVKDLELEFFHQLSGQFALFVADLASLGLVAEKPLLQ